MSSTERFARLVAGSCRVVVRGLQIWGLPQPDSYSIGTEVAAVHEAARQLRWNTYHLAGFSAGATVALAAALGSRTRVRTVLLVEPASIGDDNWGPEETRWRHELAKVRARPVEQRPYAMRDLFMARGQGPPAHLPEPPAWTAQSDQLEDMLACVGFDSADLAGLVQPTLVVSGDQSNARFLRAADRLVEVAPRARSVTYRGCSHLAPPHRAVPRQFAEDLVAFWGRSTTDSSPPR